MLLYVQVDVHYMLWLHQRWLVLSGEARVELGCLCGVVILMSQQPWLEIVHCNLILLELWRADLMQPPKIDIIKSLCPLLDHIRY